MVEIIALSLCNLDFKLGTFFLGYIFYTITTLDTQCEETTSSDMWIRVKSKNQNRANSLTYPVGEPSFSTGNVVMMALQISCFSAGLGLLVLQYHKFGKLMKR